MHGKASRTRSRDNKHIYLDRAVHVSSRLVHIIDKAPADEDLRRAKRYLRRFLAKHAPF